jgi:hypothetical protein
MIPEAEQLRQVAARVRRLTVDRRDPEAFFIHGSEIDAQLRKLARRLEQRLEEPA